MRAYRALEPGEGCARADHVAMAVFDAADDLLEEVPRLVLQQAPLFHNVVKQLTRLPCAVLSWSGSQMTSGMSQSEKASGTIALIATEVPIPETGSESSNRARQVHDAHPRDIQHADGQTSLPQALWCR